MLLHYISIVESPYNSSAWYGIASGKGVIRQGYIQIEEAQQTAKKAHAVPYKREIKPELYETLYRWTTE